jgi:hypothetical protein
VGRLISFEGQKKCRLLKIIYEIVGTAFEKVEAAA